MARLTNNQIMEMSDIEKIDYAIEHPAEARRIGNISAKTAGECYVIAAKHSAGKAVELVFGKNILAIE